MPSKPKEPIYTESHIAMVVFAGLVAGLASACYLFWQHIVEPSLNPPPSPPPQEVVCVGVKPWTPPVPEEPVVLESVEREKSRTLVLTRQDFGNSSILRIQEIEE